jgi:hypothetical protein
MAACRKGKNPPSYTSSKMNGNRLWLGAASSTGNGSSPDAFVQFGVTVVNATSVRVFADTLQFSSIDPSSHAIIFYRNIEPSSYRYNEARLYYNPADNSMEYFLELNGSYGGEFINVSTSAYKPNSSLKNYVANIAGTKGLSGTGYDTSYFPELDSSYNLNVSINFTIINDSTITFDKNILGIGDSALHYKSTNDAAKTVTFQTLHYFYPMSTLTYNYGTGKIVFEQADVNPPYANKYILLQ